MQWTALGDTERVLVFSAEDVELILDVLWGVAGSTDFIARIESVWNVSEPSAEPVGSALDHGADLRGLPAYGSQPRAG